VEWWAAAGAASDAAAEAAAGGGAEKPPGAADKGAAVAPLRWRPAYFGVSTASICRDMTTAQARAGAPGAAAQRGDSS